MLKEGKTIYDLNLKVASYSRVSTDKLDQINSLENQVNYFNDYIKEVHNWYQVENYYDEGISGTQVNHRENFLRMINDAKLGKIDMILTKEVSRFARNTCDSIKYTEMLLNYGVVVYFITDNINTIYPDSEFRLTLMASMAQDEVRKLSERVKFGIKRSIKDRKVIGGNLYGYNKQKGKLTINKDESKIVKEIFNLYASNKYGLNQISRILYHKGIFTRNNKIFSEATLKKMLTNPKYKGYYIANKTKVIDYKTHQKITLDKSEWIMEKDKSGNVPKIISESLWNKVNEIVKIREDNWKNKQTIKSCGKYLYTAKIICGTHNVPFVRNATGKRKNNPVWVCHEYLKNGLIGCSSPIIKEETLNKIFSKILKKHLSFTNNLINEILKDYQEILKNINNYQTKQDIQKEIELQNKYLDNLLDLLIQNIITKNEYLVKKETIETKLKFLNQEKLSENSNTFLNIQKYLNSHNSSNNILKYFNTLIDKVIIYKVNNSRTNLNLQIKYNYNLPDEQVFLK